MVIPFTDAFPPKHMPRKMALTNSLRNCCAGLLLPKKTKPPSLGQKSVNGEEAHSGSDRCHCGRFLCHFLLVWVHVWQGVLSQRALSPNRRSPSRKSHTSSPSLKEFNAPSRGAPHVTTTHFSYRHEFV